MKLLDAIAQADSGSFGLYPDDVRDMPHINAAHQFLYAEPYSKTKKPVSQAASELMEKLGLTGDNFDFVGKGAAATVYGNATVVFRLSKATTPPPEELPTKDIPEGLAAKILSEGTCNGVHYRLSERLNTELSPSVEEIIPFLFKAREAGVVYMDPIQTNFGIDHDDHIKVLDHNGFQKLGKPERNFERSLRDTLYGYKGSFPLYTTDDHNTYVAFAPKPSGILKRKSESVAFERTPGLQQLMFESLEAVGIHKGIMEIIEDPPVIRIPKTQITYGTPARTESLEDYIYKSLKATIRQPSSGNGGPGIS